MSKTLKTLLLIAGLVVAFVVVIRIGSAGTVFTWKVSQQGTWLLPLVSTAALIDSITPCAFSILLLTIVFLVGIGQSRTGIMKLGALYIAGIFLAYLAIGFGLIQALHIFNTPHFMAKLGAAIMIVWGVLELVNVWFPAFPIKLQIPQAAHGAIARLMNRASLPAVFLLGALVGLCEFPCTGGPYLMVIGLLHDSGTYLRGAGYLILYNLIFVLPLVIVLAIASEKSILQKVDIWRKEHNRDMRLWAGVLMILFGAALLLI